MGSWNELVTGQLFEHSWQQLGLDLPVRYLAKNRCYQHVTGQLTEHPWEQLTSSRA